MAFFSKLATSIFKYLNVAFVGYEISEITRERNPKIIEYKTIEIEKSHSETHTIIVISFMAVICIMAFLAFALKIVLKNKKERRSEKAIVAPQNSSSIV